MRGPTFVTLCTGNSRAVWCVVLATLATCAWVCGGEKPTPWWQAETAMGQGGTLTLKDKPWWTRATALRSGEHFTLNSTRPGGGRMLVRRERLRRRGKSFDAIVWVIDDDGDLLPDAATGDRDSDCYVVDYEGNGLADRMVDYMDNDRDGKPDEMDIRYFAGGQLRVAWFGIDLDHDGRMWHVPAYEYMGDRFRSDARGDIDAYDASGNEIIIANKYDPERKQWTPVSECPFAWYDLDGDGESEVTIRVAAVPLDPYPPRAVDYGNSGFNTRPFTPLLRNIGVLNVRYCRDLDGLASPQNRFHFDLGLNMTGRLPYKFDGMHHINPLRRPPRTIVSIPHADLPRLADTYPALQTGLSWHEFSDDTVRLGGAPRAGEDRRWDGVFWTWSRRIMHDTGGPIQNWNMRREFRPTPSTRREFYTCRAGRRIHLKGAVEGWTRVGHLGSRKPWGEIRTFDTDGDGFFDRWETHLAGKAAPVRVSTVRDAGIRELPRDWAKLDRVYTKEILPEALAANAKLMAAMRRLDATFRASDALVKALKAASCDGERRYVQDLIREEQFLALRGKLARRSKELLAAFSTHSSSVQSARRHLEGSTRAWALSRIVSRLDAAYGEGRYDDAIRLLAEWAKLDPKPSAAERK